MSKNKRIAQWGFDWLYWVVFWAICLPVDIILPFSSWQDVVRHGPFILLSGLMGCLIAEFVRNQIDSRFARPRNEEERGS